MPRKVIRSEAPKQDYTKINANSFIEFFGRITKIISKKIDQKTFFDVTTIENNYLFKVSSHYFSPIMEGDTIFGKGYADEEGQCIELSKPPLILPGNDEETIKKATISCLDSWNNVDKLLDEIRPPATSDDSLSDRLDTLAVAYHEKGQEIISKIFHENLSKDGATLLKWWYKRRILRRLYLFDLTNTEIRGSGENVIFLYHLILNNPYRIQSIDLEKCDGIIARLCKEINEEDRHCGFIMRWIKSRLDNKETYISKKEITTAFPDFDQNIERLINEYGIRSTPNYVGLEKVISAEEEVSSFIRTLLTRPKLKLPEEECHKLGDLVDEHKADVYQEEAIFNALQNPVTIITGGAGTGKTTILKIIDLFVKEINKNCILTSFTGKAVARIKEVVKNFTPVTLHRLIFQQDLIEDRPPVHYVVVDEASMVETKLFCSFIRYFPLKDYNYHLIFLGDINQLPPIGWGCLFNELIKSGIIPTYRLKINHRSEGRGIVDNASLLLEGNYFQATSDFHLMGNKNPLDIIKEENLPIEKVRIIAPYRDTVDETNKVIQEYFSQGDRPSLTDQKGRLWLFGDRVMMTKNNYTIGVMNGQEGFVSLLDKERNGLNVCFNGSEDAIFFSFENQDIDKILALYPPSRGKYLDLDLQQEITISAAKGKKFSSDDKKIASNSKNLFFNCLDQIDQNKSNRNDSDEDSRKIPPVDHLVLSYALTVHKSQGSEWDYVIVVLPKKATGSSFVTRNLLYTAITRAKKCVYCVGDSKTWASGILNVDKPPKQLLGNKLSTN